MRALDFAAVPVGVAGAVAEAVLIGDAVLQHSPLLLVVLGVRVGSSMLAKLGQALIEVSQALLHRGIGVGAGRVVLCAGHGGGLPFSIDNPVGECLLGGRGGRRAQQDGWIGAGDVVVRPVRGHHGCGEVPLLGVGRVGGSWPQHRPPPGRRCGRVRAGGLGLCCLLGGCGVFGSNTPCRSGRGGRGGQRRFTADFLRPGGAGAERGVGKDVVAGRVGCGPQQRTLQDTDPVPMRA